MPSDANGWHAGDPSLSRDRVLLFMHFQRAADARIPLMRDYEAGTWFPTPAPYVSSLDWPDRSSPPPSAPGVHAAVNSQLSKAP